ncbi:MAG TPA: DUF6504 family protein [Anaerolineae bacterium]|jgi:hypothetical protein
MARLWSDSELIKVELGAGGWPVRFTWNGQAHAVRQIRQRWQVDGDWWSEAGHVWREYMALTTAGGLLCVIYFNLLDQNWYLSKLYD